MKQATAGQLEQTREYDVIIVGSGTAGSTLARELARGGRRVLVLERGQDRTLDERFSSLVAIANEVKLGDEGLSSMRGLVAGGSTSLYFGVADSPDCASFAALGIDVATELEAVKRELGVAMLPEARMGAKPLALKQAAESLGHAWVRREMLVDFDRYPDYAYDAKWRARDFLDDAISAGADLVTSATVSKLVIEQGRVVGVEYARKRGFGKELQRIHGRKVIVAAGEMATPQLLRDNGIAGIGARGFYCNPGYALYGIVPGLRGNDGYVGSSSAQITPEVELGDANVHRSLHRMMMLGGMKLRHLFSYPGTLGIGVKVKDGFGGELRPDGRFHKRMDDKDREKLALGRNEALRVLEKAGARHITDFGLTAAGRIGGLVRIGEHVDSRFETEVAGLHVCDGSVIPDDQRGTPTLTIVCMARALAKVLLSESSADRTDAQLRSDAREVVAEA